MLPQGSLLFLSLLLKCLSASLALRKRDSSPWYRQLRAAAARHSLQCGPC